MGTCNELLSTWFSMVDGMAGVVLSELACGEMQCWMRLCDARQCSPMPWTAVASYTTAIGVVDMTLSSAAAFAMVSSDTTADPDTSCFHEGLLRIALCLPNSCC